MPPRGGDITRERTRFRQVYVHGLGELEAFLLRGLEHRAPETAARPNSLRLNSTTARWSPPRCGRARARGRRRTRARGLEVAFLVRIHALADPRAGLLLEHARSGRELVVRQAELARGDEVTDRALAFANEQRGDARLLVEQRELETSGCPRSTSAAISATAPS
jgi:hypothetical protein